MKIIWPQQVLPITMTNDEHDEDRLLLLIARYTRDQPPNIHHGRQSKRGVASPWPLKWWYEKKKNTSRTSTQNNPIRKASLSKLLLSGTNQTDTLNASKIHRQCHAEKRKAWQPNHPCNTKWQRVYLDSKQGILLTTTCQSSIIRKQMSIAGRRRVHYRLDMIK